MSKIAFINLLGGQQFVLPGVTLWNTATVVAAPTFTAGVENTFHVSLGPMAMPQSVYLIGATWDPVNSLWIRDDPNMVIWDAGTRDYRFQRVDHVHAVCREQVLELSGCESLRLTLYWK